MRDDSLVYHWPDDCYKLLDKVTNERLVRLMHLYAAVPADHYYCLNCSDQLAVDVVTFAAVPTE